MFNFRSLGGGCNADPPPPPRAPRVAAGAHAQAATGANAQLLHARPVGAARHAEPHAHARGRVLPRAVRPPGTARRVVEINERRADPRDAIARRASRAAHEDDACAPRHAHGARTIKPAEYSNRSTRFPNRTRTDIRHSWYVRTLDLGGNAPYAAPAAPLCRPELYFPCALGSACGGMRWRY